jgi:hypothetical protein
MSGLRSCTRTEESFALKMMRGATEAGLSMHPTLLAATLIEAHRERWSVFSDFLVANAKEPQRAEMSHPQSRCIEVSASTEDLTELQKIQYKRGGQKKLPNF